MSAMERKNRLEHKVAAAAAENGDDAHRFGCGWLDKIARSGAFYNANTQAGVSPAFGSSSQHEMYIYFTRMCAPLQHIQTRAHGGFVILSFGPHCMRQLYLQICGHGRARTRACIGVALELCQSIYNICMVCSITYYLYV